MSLIGINTRMAQDAICDDNVIIDNQNTAIAPSKDNTFHQGKDISNRWFSRKTESATWKEADARLHGCAKHHGPYKKYCIIECDGIYQAFEANLINIRVRETMNNPKTVLGQLVIFSSNSLQLIGLELMRLQGKPKKECHISARNIIELRMEKERLQYERQHYTSPQYLSFNERTFVRKQYSRQINKLNSTLRYALELEQLERAQSIKDFDSAILPSELQWLQATITD